MSCRSKIFKLRLTGIEVDCQIKSYCRSKSIRIRIINQGLLKISKPFWVSQKRALKFVQQKSDWIVKNLAKLEREKISINYGNYQRDKEKARQLIYSRLNYFSRFYNFKVNKIFVRNQSTRWGSCSARNNLNFNYRILYLDPDLADYIIVHEICHLFELNHSADFWKLVARQIPDYRERRKKLRNIAI